MHGANMTGRNTPMTATAHSIRSRTGAVVAAPPQGSYSSTPGNVPARKTDSRNFFNDSGRQDQDSTVNMMTDDVQQEHTAKKQMQSTIKSNARKSGKAGSEAGSGYEMESLGSAAHHSKVAGAAKGANDSFSTPLVRSPTFQDEQKLTPE